MCSAAKWFVMVYYKVKKSLSSSQWKVYGPTYIFKRPHNQEVDEEAAECGR